MNNTPPSDRSSNGEYQRLSKVQKSETPQAISEKNLKLQQDLAANQIETLVEGGASSINAFM